MYPISAASHAEKPTASTQSVNALEAEKIPITKQAGMNIGPADEAKGAGKGNYRDKEKGLGKGKGTGGKNGKGKAKGAKGDDAKSKGKGKGEGKGKEKGKEAVAKAVVDARVASARTKGAFPRDPVGSDSWANVRLIHQRPKPKTVFLDELKLAHGATKCHRALGPKGVPTVYVPWGKGDNIDLFPEGCLWDRWCTIIRGEEHTITTPKGRTFKIEMWGSMPYMSKSDLQRVIEDLPEATEL